MNNPTNNATPPKQGVRARERNALERISGLESDFARFVGGVQSLSRETEQKMTAMAEVIDALMELTGQEKVKETILTNRRKQREIDAKQAKDGLDNALIEGAVVQVDTVEDDPSVIITGFEKDKEGNVIHPGYVQLQLGSVKPQFKAKMVGQGKDFAFPTDLGGEFVITGVYKTVPPKESAPAPEATEKAE